MSSEWGTRAERPQEAIGGGGPSAQRSEPEVGTFDRPGRQSRRLVFDLHDGCGFDVGEAGGVVARISIWS